jgi:hypothetical protein
MHKGGLPLNAGEFPGLFDKFVVQDECGSHAYEYGLNICMGQASI